MTIWEGGCTHIGHRSVCAIHAQKHAVVAHAGFRKRRRRPAFTKSNQCNARGRAKKARTRTRTRNTSSPLDHSSTQPPGEGAAVCAPVHKRVAERPSKINVTGLELRLCLGGGGEAQLNQPYKRSHRPIWTNCTEVILAHKILCLQARAFTNKTDHS